MIGINSSIIFNIKTITLILCMGINEKTNLKPKRNPEIFLGPDPEFKGHINIGQRNFVFLVTLNSKMRVVCFQDLWIAAE